MAISILDAARQLAKTFPGRYEALAQRMNKNPSSLRHEIAGAPGYKLGAEDLEDMTNLALEVKQDNALIILATMASNCGQMLVPLPTALLEAGDDCLKRMGDSAREFGELCTEVATDLGDGKISDNELARIDRECSELIASLHALREALAKRNAAGKAGEGA